MTEQDLVEIKTELEHSEIPRPSQEKILEACEKQSNNSWIPVNLDDENTFPPNDEYILLSLSNFSIPIIGRYETDADGGAFYCGDEDETLASHDIFVNAWQPLPEPYREENKHDGE